MSYGEIKKAVNSDLTKPLNTLITEVKTALESTLNAKASQTSVTEVQTTANTINTNVNTLLGGRTVKSVQRGTFITAKDVNSAYKATSISVSTVNMAKSILNTNGVVFESNGTSNYNEGVNAFMAQLVSSTQIDIKLISAHNASPYYAYGNWELIELY